MLKPRSETRATRDPVSFRAALAGWFVQNGRDLPWRRTQDPYVVFVSELMLQQTQVATVLAGGYFTRFLKTFPSVEKLAAASDDALLKAWEGLGYYRRVRLMRSAAQAVIDGHGGEFPSDLDALLALPGVGPYTAGALRAFAFDLPAVLVDGNIARVIARLENHRQPIDTSTGQSKVWELAGKLACPERPRIHHSALMELGQTVCRPGAPDCLACPVSRWCAARAPEKLPFKQAKIRITPVEEHAVFIRDSDGRVLLHRESGARRQGLWKLPVRPLDDVGHHPVIEREHYTITRYKVALIVREALALDVAEDEAWIPAGDVAALAMPAPYRRVIGRLLGFGDESV
ncbi:MAG: A/G-specific adenine glycosylase [Luteolibacter sp.]|jgi:A/G-specific adenine glycosylase